MKTLVLGASTNPSRYSYLAAKRLANKGIETVLLSNKVGNIDGQAFVVEKEAVKEIDTVTVYLAPQNQAEYYDYIAALSPRRVIFNPGSENWDWIKELESAGVQVLTACTLVMLSTEQY